MRKSCFPYVIAVFYKRRKEKKCRNNNWARSQAWDLNNGEEFQRNGKSFQRVFEENDLSNNFPEMEIPPKNSD